MNKEVEYNIERINWQVWFYNPYHSSKRPLTNIMTNPLDTAKIIKNACQMIIDNKDNDNIVNSFIEQIEIACYGNIYTEKKSRLRQMPDWVASIIIEHCDKIINIYNSNSDSNIQNLLDKFKHRWLYKNNHESVSFVMYIDNISYKDKNIVWSGNFIELNTENSKCDWGINFKSADEKLFSNIIDCKDNSIADIEDKLNSLEVLSDVNLKELIANQLYWGFALKQDQYEWPNLYDGCNMFE